MEIKWKEHSGSDNTQDFLQLQKQQSDLSAKVVSFQQLWDQAFPQMVSNICTGSLSTPPSSSNYMEETLRGIKGQ
jgi:hypothetical protein